MTRLSLRRLGGLALATIAWLAAAGGCAAPDPPALIGTVVLAEGEVSVRRPNSDKWEPAQPNQKLHEGDAVRTGPASRAVILSHRESQVKLNERDRLVVKSSASSRWEIWPQEERLDSSHAEITSFQGQVAVFRDERGQWQPAQLNQKLYVGDLVRTGPASRATITLYPDPADKRIKLDETEILVVQKLEIYRGLGATSSYDREPKACGAINFIHGEVTVNGKPAKLGQRLFDGHVVRTGPASCAIVGFFGDGTLYDNPELLLLEEDSEVGIPERGEGKKFRFKFPTPPVTPTPRG